LAISHHADVQRLNGISSQEASRKAARHTTRESLTSCPEREDSL
jgi:hypothetical protein